ncbi:hypothetical protein [Ancylobacter oerskovii]|uniref:LytR/CpsA/Psr regulator C-terminal domain-containing protein n=1 Tax=Ancylobacter oerskovii TaxID=459519 RepID=A0ABW4Z442_9HYPH|nr:hypothetical protein [Ancylobacter oerskovii]MBS7546141.1 hypothetical protein [Ancylobacter oerskovii]
MTDKREPSFENGTTPPEAGSPAATQPPPAPAPRPAPAPAKTGRTPPEDPVAFQRWIEIEKLKIELKRLELESQHLHHAAAEPPSNMLAYVTLALVAAVAGLLIYMLTMLVPLREEVGRLRTAQIESPADLAAATPAAPSGTAPVPASPPPEPSAAQSPSPQAAAPQATDPALQPPASDTPAPAPSDSAATEPAPPPAVTYTVRIFATASADKAKLERFANVAKAAGFNVDVSSTEVFQPLRNALSYHPSVADAAGRLAKALQAKYPGINLDSKPSPSITDIAKNVLILNVMDDAVN